MKKAPDLILKMCLLVFIASFAASMYLLISESGSPLPWRYAGAAASVLFTVIVTAEVLNSPDAKPAVKAVWVLSFLIFQIFAGLAYYLTKGAVGGISSPGNQDRLDN